MVELKEIIDNTYSKMEKSVYNKIDKRIKKASKSSKTSTEIKFSHRISSKIIDKALENYEKEGFRTYKWSRINWLGNNFNTYVKISWEV